MAERALDGKTNLTLTSVVFEFMELKYFAPPRANLTLTSVVFESHAISKTMAVMII